MVISWSGLVRTSVLGLRHQPTPRENGPGPPDVSAPGIGVTSVHETKLHGTHSSTLELAAVRDASRKHTAGRGCTGYCNVGIRHETLLYFEHLPICLSTPEETIGNALGDTPTSLSDRKVERSGA